MGHNSRHGGLTRSLLAVTQHLAQKRPHSDDGRIDGVHAKQVAMLGEHTLDAFGGKHTGERQSWLSQERRHNFLKPLTPSSRFPATLCIENPSLVLSGDQTKEGAKNIAKDGYQLNGNRRSSATYSNYLTSVKVRYAPNEHLQPRQCHSDQTFGDARRDLREYPATDQCPEYAERSNLAQLLLPIDLPKRPEPCFGVVWVDDDHNGHCPYCGGVLHCAPFPAG
jgi:hypothetical protein